MSRGPGERADSGNRGSPDGGGGRNLGTGHRHALTRG